MNRLTRKGFKHRIAHLLKEFIGEEAKTVRPSGAKADEPHDWVFWVGGHTFLMEAKKSAAAADISRGIDEFRKSPLYRKRGAIPVLVVPFMGPVGQRLCEQAGISWLDLSGNARIDGPGLRVYVMGRPNQYKQVGRPSTPFAPRSARVARQLLLDPAQFLTQRELAKATRLGEGFVSKIVRRLEADRLLERNEAGAVRPRDPSLLLDAWYEAYEFSRHIIIRCHVAARSGETATREAAGALRRVGMEHAATGLAGAWLLTRFAGFRVASLYVSEAPGPELLLELGARQEERGANLWLIIPDDEGVFSGAADRDGVRCAHPVQVYLDLKGHPERAAEAAQELRRQYLSW
jgi:hypothetical protein